MSASTTIDTRLHPIQAFRAIRRLIAAPDDTRQVFVVLQAMRGRSAARLFARFAAHPNGQAILQDRRSLLATLQNHTALAALPEASLGRAYLAFMLHEQLSAGGLATLSQQEWRPAPSDDMALVRDRQRDAHDLAHVLTGYGQDPLGELCLLAFSYAQTRHLGMAMIALMGMARMPRTAGKARRAVLQGWRHGRRAAWLQAQDWEALLPQNLHTVRQTLQIAPPTLYQEVIA